MKTTFSLVVSCAILLVLAGCGINYRVGSVINTASPSPVAWKGAFHNIQGEQQIYINPYTFNPNDPGAYGLILLNQRKSGPPAYIYGLENKSSWVSGGFYNWLSAATNMDFASIALSILVVTNVIEIKGHSTNGLVVITTNSTPSTTITSLHQISWANDSATTNLILSVVTNNPYLPCWPGATGITNFVSIIVSNSTNITITLAKDDPAQSLTSMTISGPLAKFTTNVGPFFTTNTVYVAGPSKSRLTYDQNERYKMILEVFAPLYWKASESTNITGLTDDDRKYYRNDLQNALFQVIKESTEQHLAGLKSTENNANLLLGAATIGLSGGASIADATTAKALAAAATGTAGAQALFNSQVYRDTFVEATIALIENDQAQFLASVKTNQTRNIYDYTVEAAIADAKEYEMRGSFYHGLALLQEAVQNKINGGSNIVTITQYAPSITSPSEIDLSVNESKNVSITGQGFAQLDLSSLNNFSNSVYRVVGAPGVSSDNTIAITLQSVATNKATESLSLPWRNKQGILSIPVTITNQ